MLPARKGGSSAMKRRITVTQENSTGRNTKFHDNVTGENMTRAGFVKKSIVVHIAITMYAK